MHPTMTPSTYTPQWPSHFAKLHIYNYPITIWTYTQVSWHVNIPTVTHTTVTWYTYTNMCIHVYAHSHTHTNTWHTMWQTHIVHTHKEVMNKHTHTEVMNKHTHTQNLQWPETGKQTSMPRWTAWSQRTSHKLWKEKHKTLLSHSGDSSPFATPATAWLSHAGMTNQPVCCISHSSALSVYMCAITQWHNS